MKPDYGWLGYTYGMEPTANNVRESIINPYYCVSFAENLFNDQKIEVANEDWVQKNSQLIAEMGSTDWLERLLVSLSTGPLVNPTYWLICPRKTVVISDRLRGEHEPAVTKGVWLAANTKLIKELGTGKWLWQLLSVLETGGVEA